MGFSEMKLYGFFRMKYLGVFGNKIFREVSELKFLGIFGHERFEFYSCNDTLDDLSMCHDNT